MWEDTTEIEEDERLRDDYEYLSTDTAKSRSTSKNTDIFTSDLDDDDILFL